jgi:hypothetical protein
LFVVNHVFMTTDKNYTLAIINLYGGFLK